MRFRLHLPQFHEESAYRICGNRLGIEYYIKVGRFFLISFEVLLNEFPAFHIDRSDKGLGFLFGEVLQPGDVLNPVFEGGG